MKAFIIPVMFAVALTGCGVKNQALGSAPLAKGESARAKVETKGLFGHDWTAVRFWTLSMTPSAQGHGYTVVLFASARRDGIPGALTIKAEVESAFATDKAIEVKFGAKPVNPREFSSIHDALVDGVTDEIAAQANTSQRNFTSAQLSYVYVAAAALP